MHRTDVLPRAELLTELARWLEENSLEAHAIDAQYEGERDETAVEPGEAEP